MFRGRETQRDLVARMSSATGREYKRAWLSAIENGHRDVNREDIAVLARTLGVTPNDLFGVHDEEPADANPCRLEHIAKRYHARVADADLDIVEDLLARLAGDKPAA